MNRTQFEKILDTVATQLGKEAASKPFDSSKQFEDRVRVVLRDVSIGQLKVDFDSNPQAFPDIALGDFGVEVKFTTQDTWRSVANSVLESTRNANVKFIYLMFGKMGGVPGVKWGVYEDCVMHVRTSPRWPLQTPPPVASQTPPGRTCRLCVRAGV